ncbi:protein LE25-like isoform X1 [Phalaenopsis equestris]|uniref:protein LE25-like isoform X1 n=1 Tax=Phalaenopsis equestris TaxID=78828 RepID=UPI0009E40FED|nr:protein LE25-like isoform X1 [Phalaenopsis equestris]
MEAAKEKISNVAASATAGMDKSKAVAAEKAEKLKTRDPLQKEAAEERKHEKISQAELDKQQAYKENAIKKGEAHHTGVGHATGLGGHHAGVGDETGLGGHHTGVGHETGLGGHHIGVGHPEGLVGHQTGVEHQTGLGDPTGHTTGGGVL